jgi:hypothetical protein
MTRDRETALYYNSPEFEQYIIALGQIRIKNAEIENLKKTIEIISKCAGCGFLYGCENCPVMKDSPICPECGAEAIRHVRGMWETPPCDASKRPPKKNVEKISVKITRETRRKPKVK